jgi:hypothetical protein
LLMRREKSETINQALQKSVIEADF